MSTWTGLWSRAAGRPAPGSAAPRRVHHAARHDQPVHRAEPRRPRRCRGGLRDGLHSAAPPLTHARFMIAGSLGHIGPCANSALGAAVPGSGTWGLFWLAVTRGSPRRAVMVAGVVSVRVAQMV